MNRTARRRYRSANTLAEKRHRMMYGLFLMPIFLFAAIAFALSIGAIAGTAAAVVVLVAILVAGGLYAEWRVGTRPEQKQVNSPTQRKDGTAVVDRDYMG